MKFKVIPMLLVCSLMFCTPALAETTKVANLTIDDTDRARVSYDPTLTGKYTSKPSEHAPPHADIVEEMKNLLFTFQSYGIDPYWLTQYHPTMFLANVEVNDGNIAGHYHDFHTNPEIFLYYSYNASSWSEKIALHEFGHYVQFKYINGDAWTEYTTVRDVQRSSVWADDSRETFAEDFSRVFAKGYVPFWANAKFLTKDGIEWFENLVIDTLLDAQGYTLEDENLDLMKLGVLKDAYLIGDEEGKKEYLGSSITLKEFKEWLITVHGEWAYKQFVYEHKINMYNEKITLKFDRQRAINILRTIKKPVQDPLAKQLKIKESLTEEMPKAEFLDLVEEMTGVRDEGFLWNYNRLMAARYVMLANGDKYIAIDQAFYHGLLDDKASRWDLPTRGEVVNMLYYLIK